MKKILVIQTAFLGDAVLATALLEKINNCLPGAAVDILVRKGNESLFSKHPFISQVLVWDKNKSKFSTLFNVLQKIRNNKYDAVVNLQRFFSSGFLTVLSGASIKSGFDKNPLSFFYTHVAKHVIGDGRHEVERNSMLLSPWCDTSHGKPKLYPSSEDVSKIEEYVEVPFITLAPASVWFTKKLPVVKWTELIKSIPSDLKIILIGAPNDITLCEEIIKLSTEKNTLNLAGKLNLLQTAALMQRAQMNYVNDSGPLHIASAMNAPVTAFFCSTIPEFGFGPLSDYYSIVQTDQKLECKPCGLHGRNECPMGHFRCALTIDVTQLQTR